MRGTLAFLLLLVAFAAQAYPTDAYERTHIRRLAWQKQVDAGLTRGLKLPPGSLWPSERVVLRMLGPGRDFELTALTAKDPQLQAALEELLKKGSWQKYGVALLDISDPAHPRYAAVRESEGLTPGSVAKVLAAAALLQQLQLRFPDIADREKMLREVQVATDEWALPDPHEVPIISGDKLEQGWQRKLKARDTFSLWEWVDHALSPSSNGAASMVWREATLMKLLGPDYPPAKVDATLWKRWKGDELTEAAYACVEAPVRAAGIAFDDFNLRLMFTRSANKYVHGLPSRATPLGLVQWMLKVEQGRMIDEFSSLELKRLLYVTRRRIRYASAPELLDSAVFTKSGSFYECVSGDGCAAYEGSLTNVLNEMIEVETPPAAVAQPPGGVAPPAAVGAPPPTVVAPPPAAPMAPASPTAAEPTVPSVPAPAPAAPESIISQPVAGTPRVYIIAVMSNELRRNASNDHAALAAAIQHLMVAP